LCLKILEAKKMKAILTVIGKDKVGIIANVSTLLFEKNANILDINQTIMDDFFTMVMLVDLTDINLSLKELNEILKETGKSLKVSIKMQHENVFNSMHLV
jgi:ACT domain-containing protein